MLILLGSKNKEVVAVTILGAPHRWEGGTVYVWGLQTSALYVRWSVAILALDLKTPCTAYPLYPAFPPARPYVKRPLAVPERHTRQGLALTLCTYSKKIPQNNYICSGSDRIFIFGLIPGAPEQ